MLKHIKSFCVCLDSIVKKRFGGLFWYYYISLLVFSFCLALTFSVLVNMLILTP